MSIIIPVSSFFVIVGFFFKVDLHFSISHCQRAVLLSLGTAKLAKNQAPSKILPSCLSR